MVISAWWMIIVWVCIIGTFIVIRKKYPKIIRQNKKRKTKNVAHIERIHTLNSYKKIVQTYWVFIIIGFLSSLVALFLLIFISARPSSQTFEYPNQRNRDIMLCLDVSGSMTETVTQILSLFSDLSGEFKGERLGLTAFDSSSVNVFPLTDDYQFIKTSLDEAVAELENYEFGELTSGTTQGSGSSLIGDGLASCVLRFSQTNERRSKSIILATDNFANGDQIISFPEAGALAKEREIRVYGINPGDYSIDGYSDPSSEEFKNVTLATDGGYYKLPIDQPGSKQLITDIVSKVSEQEATRFKGAPYAVISDKPQIVVLIAYFAIITHLIITWRIKE